MSALASPAGFGEEVSVDIAEAQRFIDAMAGGQPVTFQTFDDTPAKRGDLATARHSTLSAADPGLRELNARAAGVFWMVNFGDGEGRKTANVTGVRAGLLDLDGAPLQPVLAAGLPPHAVIESSPGKWHVYWLVTGCDREMFRPMQKALASKFGGDRSVNDLPRVLRVPGFVHRKGAPFVTRIESLNPIEPYAFDELVQRLGLDLQPPVPAATRKASQHIDPGTGEILDTVAEGGRHHYLVRWAGQLNWRGMSPNTIRAAVQEENDRVCDPPKSTAEVDDIVDDVLERYGDQHGRDFVTAQAAAAGSAPADEERSARFFKDVDLSRLGTHLPPAQEWWWEGYLPAGHAALLSGHGGAGKSTFALMLAVALCAKDEFFGKPTKSARVLFFSGEDPEALVLHRLTRICRSMALDIERVKQKLCVIDATEFDPVLFTERRVGAVRTGAVTRTYTALLEYIDERGIDVLIVDNASDTYGADEIDRGMVRGFIRSLVRLVRQRGGAALLLSHVDKTTSRAPKGLANSESYSGSTAWHNSVRSRLFLMEREPGLLVLEHQKSNLVRKQAPILLVWPEGGLPQLAPDDITLGDAQPKADEPDAVALLRLIHEYAGRGEFVATATNSPANAAKLFAKEPSFPRTRKPAAVTMLLREAERGGLVRREVYRSPDRKPRERWTLTPAGVALVEAAPSAPSAPAPLLGADGAVGTITGAAAPSAPCARWGCGGGARTQPDGANEIEDEEKLW